MNVFNQVIRTDLLGVTPPVHDGMTFAVKANIGCGYQASASTPSLRGWVPNDVSPVVKSLLDSGHKVVAVTNMHELAFGITSENPAFGDVKNPCNREHIAGGSSGGSAAAVAMNAVSFALGTDTGGSVRIPAALCGVVGYRPTTGLYDRSAVCPLSSTTDTIGVLAQEVQIIQHVHKAIIPAYSPGEQCLSSLKFGVPRRYYYSVLDNEVSQVTETALKALSSAGVQLVDASFPLEFERDMISTIADLAAYEMNRLVPKYLKEQKATVSFDELCDQVSDPVVKSIVMNASNISDERYKDCLLHAQEIRELFENYFKVNSIDAFVCPTTILPAAKRPSPKSVKVGGEEFPTFCAYVHNTTPQAIAGVPCISLPCGLTRDRLPVGLELVAPHGMDNHLLDMAVSIQSTLPSLPKLSFNDFKDSL